MKQVDPIISAYMRELALKGAKKLGKQGRIDRAIKAGLASAQARSVKNADKRLVDSQQLTEN